MTSNETDSDHERLRAFATATLGQVKTIEDCSRHFGRKSVTWRITARDGQLFYLKRHEESRLYVTERIIYTKWMPKLPKSHDWQTPEVVGDSAELGAFLLTAVPGEILEEADASIDEKRKMYCVAGQLAAEIHRLDVDAHEVGPARTYGRETWGGYFESAIPYLDSETLGWIERVLSGNDLFLGLSLVPTHCDYSPRNWLIDRSGGKVTLGLIDWERARAGYWLEDAQRLVFDYWLKDPELRTAFFEGYGRQPTPTEDRQMDLICLANALGTVPWAIEREDYAFAEFGRTVLRLVKERLA